MSVSAKNTAMRFEIVGPLDIPHDGRGDTKGVDQHHEQEFWKRHNSYAVRRGVYILGVRAGPGYTPIYVGQAKRTFQQEVLNDRNLLHLNLELRNWKRSRPVMFLVVHPLQRGQVNRSAIREAERLLIGMASSINPQLRNKQHTKTAPSWEIVGVTTLGVGKPSYATKTLRRMLGLR